VTISELKEYIYKENKIPFILEQLGCHNIKFNKSKEVYSAAHKDGDNPQGVVIRNNAYLGYRSYSRGVDYEDNQDLISLVQTTNKLSFIEALKYLHKILEIPFEFKKSVEKPKKKCDPLNVFTKHLRCNKRVVNVDDIKVLEDKLLNDYVPMLHIDWLRDGIMPWTRKKFGLCYSFRYKRVIIPHRFWMTGQLIATNARTTIANWEEFNIKKYILTSGYNKQLNIYGLYENYDAIQKAGYVCVYEAEKSVLKRDSLCDSTGVAISGHSLSQEQIEILIGLNVDIILAMDNDVPIEEVRHMANKFYGIRNVYYVQDKWDLIPKKSSPADCPNKVFKFLMKHKTKYDENERSLYLKSLEKR
jgi:DNA primase